ncbi:MAG: hypothetical protein ACLQVL_21120 [Terriglobia bacterium]
MSLIGHRHSRRQISAGNPLSGRTVYIPTMGEGSPEAFAAAFRWLGVNAQPTPLSDERTRELGAKYTSGDECYPAKVTVGDFLRVTELPGFDPDRTSFFMPTADGPCRFGQYAPFLRKILNEAGFSRVQVLSPTSQNGYVDLGGEIATAFLRMAWRALVCADTVHRALLKTRPYETTPGAADRAFQESLQDVCKTVEEGCADTGCQLRSLVEAMTRCRDRFRRVPALYDPEIPLIGVVGEIFCRLNTFSNEDLIRKLEGYGAECCLSHIGEWVSYTNAEAKRKLLLTGRKISWEMAKTFIRSHIQHADEEALIAPFKEDFVGYEEPPIEEVLDLAWPYLPTGGALGEMVLSVGKAAYHAKHGADGIIDISPFTCMNGIVTEAIYPKLSKAYGGIPIRNFYFDGTQADLDRDLGIYMELARSYREKKPYRRHYPAYFVQPVA